MILAPAAWTLAALCTQQAPDAIDDFVTEAMAQKKIPGVAVLVMRDGEIERAKGYGLANLEHQVPVTSETLFQSGSIGKMFTAAGILLLAEEGKVSLDDRLARFFPEGPSSWHRITIRHLLTHTSGIKDYGDEFDYKKSYTDDEMLAVMQQLPLEFEPGTQWSYSNSGYLILGLLTTKVAGKHWGEFQAERIFRPLGMTTAQMISEREQRGERRIGHGGAWQGFRSAIARYPDQGLMVAVLANLDAAAPSTMAHEIAGLVEPALRPRDLDDRSPDPDPARTGRLREVLEAWASFRPHPAMTQGLAEMASGSQREAEARSTAAKRLAAATSFVYLGEDQLSQAARQLNGNGAVRGVDYMLETPEARHAYRFLLDADGRVVTFAPGAR